MMKKIAITALYLVTAFTGISFADNADFSKANFKRTFCNNQEYLGNGGAKRPHLHCGANFISYKKANGDHSNITEMGDCNRTNSVFDDIKANRTAFAHYEAIYNALVLYHQAGCPNQ
ncbi:hypothetical protein [Legionella rowbothamii]|uniref:hypothetical protein n=1 Tax=Legionella rowbothamii TaxID=96229 RepID=UPI001F5F0311|nr:hypothetical protein [Legionella rowbothamii]